MEVSRREMVRYGLAVSGGLIVACKTTGSLDPRASRLAGDESTPVDPAHPLVSWIQVTSDNKVKYFMPWTEMGQGIGTGLAALIGEEMDVDPAEIVVVYAGANSLLPDTEEYTPSGTGGSSSMRGSYDALRKAAAAARDMLVAAAASGWGVSPDECTVQNKSVVHQSSGRTATYGSLAAAAAGQPVPGSPHLKDAANFKYIGKPVPRNDLRPKVDGTAVFGIDVKVPNMVNATIVHCPYVGGKVGSVDDAAAKASPGVTHVLRTPYGVAVVADTFFRAKQGATLLKITWADMNPNLSSASMLAEMKGLVEADAMQALSTGDFAGSFSGAAKKVEAYYQAPYLPHSTLEPQNCTADVRPTRVEIWAPTQDPDSARDVAAAMTGVPRGSIKVNVTLGGGGFGRRLRQDYIGEACYISKQVGKPVKLLWTRPEEFIRDWYRPASYNKLQAGLDDSGNIVAWMHRIASSSIIAWLSEDPVVTPAHQTSADGPAVEGAKELLYTAQNQRVEWAQHEPGIPVSWWRSVGFSQNTWIIECFLDELAQAAGKDPLQYRLGLLKDEKHKALLQLAADKIGWSTPPAAGIGRGLAIAASFGSVVAEAAEVQVADGALAVKRVVAVVDCGLAVNPFLVQTQIQSAICQALGAALHQEITVKAGKIEQSSFAFADRGTSQGGCPLLAFSETPLIEVYVQPGSGTPGGIGEPGVPPLAPAVCNAIFAASGKRIRKLPISLT